MTDDSPADAIKAFCEREFTGRDLLTIMDVAGIGVGATMHLVKDIDGKIERGLCRPWGKP